MSQLTDRPPASNFNSAAPVRRWGPVGLWALLGLFVGWLRLRALGYTECGGDPSTLINIALEWVHGGALPLASIKTSFGIFNAPFIEYLYALPLFIKPDIVGIVWLIALVNLAGLALFGYTLTRLFGHRLGWASVLWFAILPWGVYFGRVIWPPTVIPGLTLAAFACFLLYLTKQPRWYYLVGGLLGVALAIQAHPVSGLLLPTLLLAGLCFWRQLRPGHLLLGLTVAALTFTPFLVFQIRNNWVDLTTAREGWGRPAQTDLAVVGLALDLVQSKGFYFTPDNTAATIALRNQDPLGPAADTVIALLMGLALVSALGHCLYQGRKKGAPWNWPGAAKAQLLSLLWLLPLLALIRHNHTLQIYYFLFLYPPLVYLPVQFCLQVYQWLRHWPRLTPALRSGLVALACLPLGLVIFQQTRLDLLAQNMLAGGTVGRQRAVDVQRAITAAQRLAAMYADCQVVVISEGAQFDQSRFGLFKEFIGRDRVRFVAAGSSYLWPAPCALYFQVTAEPATQSWLAENTTPLPVETIQTPEQTWTFHYLSPTQRATATAALQPPVPKGQWQNGLQLNALQMSGQTEPGQPLTGLATWAVTETPAPREVHFGVYLLKPDGALLTQADGVGLDSTTWRTGDIFQTRFALPLPPETPPGDYQLALALYFYPEIERLPLTTGADLLELDKITLGTR